MSDPHSGLQQLLQQWRADLDAAELHGQVVGWLCGAGQPQEGRWLDRLGLVEQLPDATEADAERVLGLLAQASWAALEDSELGFQPLLPDDDGHALETRVAALLHWSQGFLAGLGLSGFAAAEGMVGEFLGDLGSIAAASVEALDADEAGEMAYAELVEFLRMGALMVHLSRRAPGS